MSRLRLSALAVALLAAPLPAQTPRYNVTALAVPTGYELGGVVGVSNTGVVAGNLSVTINSASHSRVVAWQNGAATVISPLNGLAESSITANGIGGGGLIVGQSNVGTQGASHGFSYAAASGTLTDLGVTDGTNFSVAYGASGQAGFVSSTGGIEGYAFACRNGVITDLGALGWARSTARASRSR